MTHRSRKSERAKTIDVSTFVKDFDFSGATLGSSVGPWSSLGAVLEPLGSILAAILSHLGPAISEAILDPSSAILGNLEAFLARLWGLQEAKLEGIKK